MVEQNFINITLVVIIKWLIQVIYVQNGINWIRF
jgi:hypothetical protein